MCLEAHLQQHGAHALLHARPDQRIKLCQLPLGRALCVQRSRRRVVLLSLRPNLLRDLQFARHLLFVCRCTQAYRSFP